MQESGKSIWTNGDNPKYPTTAANSREHVDLRDLCARLHGRVAEFLDKAPEQELSEKVQKQTRSSLKIFDEALQNYSLPQLCFAYNGGKDCLVLLILYLVALHKHFGSTTNAASPPAKSTSHQRFPQSLKSIYIVPPQPFPQVEEFVLTSSEDYHLDLYTSTLPMKEAFEEYLQHHPEVRAIFVGTRRTDPHGSSLKHFDPTDGGWPDFVRVHPVIDWNYREIWSFIRHFEIPYCQLYDMGYTSLGGQSDTYPNPSLRTDASEAQGDATGERIYRPAYELMEDTDERLGRKKS